MKRCIAIGGAKAHFTIKETEYDELLTKLIEYSAGTKLVLNLSREEATKLSFFMMAAEMTPEPKNAERDLQIWRVEL